MSAPNHTSSIHVLCPNIVNTVDCENMMLFWISSLFVFRTPYYLPTHTIPPLLPTHLVFKSKIDKYFIGDVDLKFLIFADVSGKMMSRGRTHYYY